MNNKDTSLIWEAYNSNNLINEQSGGDMYIVELPDGITYGVQASSPDHALEIVVATLNSEYPEWYTDYGISVSDSVNTDAVISALRDYFGGTGEIIISEFQPSLGDLYQISPSSWD